MGKGYGIYVPKTTRQAYSRDRGVILNTVLSEDGDYFLTATYTSIKCYSYSKFLDEIKPYENEKGEYINSSEYLTYDNSTIDIFKFFYHVQVRDKTVQIINDPQGETRHPIKKSGKVRDYAIVTNKTNYNNLEIAKKISKRGINFIFLKETGSQFFFLLSFNICKIEGVE